jgi:pantoate--beta-alanine ligase
LTVVHRLCEMVSPDVVVLGHKDAQQLFLIKDMVAKNSLPFSVEAVETVRDPDGLALSSRNSFLTTTERTAALALTRALDLASQQESIVAAVAAARRVLEAEPQCEVDYVAVIDPDTFLEIEALPSGGVCQMLIAATIGTTRLIDNKRFSIPQ